MAPAIAAAPAAFGIGGGSTVGAALTGGASGAVLGGADAAARGQNIGRGALLGGALGVAAPLAGRAIGAVLSPAAREPAADAIAGAVPAKGVERSGSGGSLGQGAAAAEAGPAAIAKGELSANAPTGNFYSVLYETKLKPTSYRASRDAHYQEANENLLREMEGDADHARIMQDAGVDLQRTLTGLAPRTPPDGFTWHHAEEPGVMQLVPRQQHERGSVFQDALHPNGRGGYSKWGKPLSSSD